MIRMYFEEPMQDSAGFLEPTHRNAHFGKIEVGRVEARGHTNALLQDRLGIGTLSRPNIKRTQIV